MSFTPMLIICKKDLDKKEIRINHLHSQAEEKNKRGSNKWHLTFSALEFLVKAMKGKPVQFRDESFIITTPDLTSINQEVRDILDQEEIYYEINI